MNCKQIFEKLSDYLDREVDPKICRDIEEHIKDCKPCVKFINTLSKTMELFRGVGRAKSEDIPKPVSTKLMSFLRENIHTGKTEDKH